MEKFLYTKLAMALAHTPPSLTERDGYAVVCLSEASLAAAMADFRHSELYKAVNSHGVVVLACTEEMPHLEVDELLLQLDLSSKKLQVSELIFAEVFPVVKVTDAPDILGLKKSPLRRKGNDYFNPSSRPAVPRKVLPVRERGR
ncbi:MAG: hypothetical protein V4481_03240 [Patescibacteria group bacterium]